MVAGVVDRAFLCDAHPVLNLGKDLLDRVEVGRVRRQVPQPGAGFPDHLTDGRRLVATEIIHNDDVARFEHGYELLFDIGAEAFAVDRSVEHARRSELVTT